jgi:hypothetical protein
MTASKPDPAPIEDPVEETADFYLAAARTELAEALARRVEYRDQLVTEIIRKQQALATSESTLSHVRNEIEAMAMALENMPERVR